MTRARRGALTLLAALLSLTVLAACGGAPTAEAPEEAADTEGTEANTQEVASETAQSGETPTAEETQAAAETVDLGCEDTFPAVYAELDGLEGDERRSRLLELAKEEGELMVYTSNNVVMDLGPVFQEEFGIPTEVYRAPSDQVSQRVHEEADASSILSDIIDNIAPWQVVALRSGLLAEYEGPVRDEVPEIARGRGFIGNQYLPHVVAWNTELIPAEEVPTSYEDLADPKWKGRVTLEPRHSAMYMALFQHFGEEGRSEDEVRELFRSIGENAVLMDGNTQRVNLMVTGEYPLGVGIFVSGVDDAAATGAPVAWEPAVEPVYVETFGSGLTMCAAHPAAALLWYEWVATDGQEPMAELGRVTTPEFTEGGRLAGLETLTIDYATFVDEQQQWESEWHDLIGYQ